LLFLEKEEEEEEVFSSRQYDSVPIHDACLSRQASNSKLSL